MIIKKYFLAVLSPYVHQEGYLNLALRDLIDAGKAVQGLGLQYLIGEGRDIRDIEIEPHLIKIVYNKNNIPMILFRLSDFNEVKKELEKRAVRAEALITSDSLDALVGYVDNDSIHEEIKEKIDLELRSNISKN